MHENAEHQFPGQGESSPQKPSALFSLLSVFIALFVGAVGTACAQLVVTPPTVNINATTVLYPSYNPENTPVSGAVDGAGNQYIPNPYCRCIVLIPVNGAAQTVGPGPGITIQFGQVNQVAVDQQGNLFIVDRTLSSVLEQPAGGGQTISLGSGFSSPEGIAVDGQGNVYVADTGNARVVELPAGGGAQINVNIPGLAPPQGLALDTAGNLYVTQPTVGRVLKVPSGGGSSSVVGTGFVGPTGVAVDSAGNIFVADLTNGVIEVPAGGGPQSTLVSGSTSVKAGGVWVDTVGDVFYQGITPSGGFIQEVQRSAANFSTVSVGSSSTMSVAISWLGTQGASFSSGGINVLTQGAAGLDFTSSGSNCPQTLASGSSCVIDVKFSPRFPGLRQGAVQVLDSSGNVAATLLLRGVGNAPQLVFPGAQPTTIFFQTGSSPAGVAVDAVGNVDVATTNIVEQVPGGCASSSCYRTLGPASSNLSGLAVDGAGSLYIGNNYGRLLRLPAGCTSFACEASLGSIPAFSIALDGFGDIFLANPSVTGNIEEISALGPITTFGSGLNGVFAVSEDSNSDLFVSTGNDTVVEVPALGSPQTAVSSSIFASGIQVSPAGNIFAADVLSGNLYEFPSSCSTASCANVLATGLNNPKGLARDHYGNLYVSEAGSDQVIEILRLFRGLALPFYANAGSSETQNVVVENDGNQPLIITAVSTTGGPFTAAFGTCVTSLAPGASCALSVTYSPSATGVSSSELNIFSNSYNQGSNSPVPLEGFGTSPQSTLTVNVVSPATFNSTQTLTTTGGSGTGAVTFSVGASTACYLSGSTLTITSGTGTCSVFATKAGDSNFGPATSSPASVTVQPASQATLMVDAVSPATYQSTQVISTTGGSGTGAITYSVGASTACSVSGPTLTITSGTGTCSVTATQAADSNYNAATSAPVTITVQPAGQATLTVNAVSPATYNSTQTLTTAGGSGTGAITFSVGASTACLVSGSTLTITSGTGICSITATKAADSNYFAATSSPVTVAAQPSSQAILMVVATSPAAYYSIQTLTTTGGSGTGSVTFSVGASTACSVNGSILTITSSTGTCSITASKSADSNYSAATSSPATIAILSSKTTTALTVTSAGSPVSAIATGNLVVLSASVTDASTNPVTHGTVTFYNGVQSLGTVGVVSQTAGSTAAGTATLRLASLPPGINSLTALFNGFNTAQASTSSAVQLTVTGLDATTTTLASSGVQGSYILTATVGAGGMANPTGGISFTDTSTNTTLGTVPITAANQSAVFLNSSTPAIGAFPATVAVGDFNGDGKLDFVTANVSGSAMFTVALGNGDGTFIVLPGTGSSFAGAVQAVVVGDFNGDGKLDIATGNGSSVGVFLGNGDGTFGPETDYPITGTLTYALAVGDMNRDGILDIVTANSQASSISVLLGNGDGTFGTHHDFAVGNFATGVALGDFNKDGKLDIAVSNYNDSTVGILLGNGDGTLQPQQTFAVGPQPVFLAVADVNGDGNLDIVIPDKAQNAVGVLLGNGNGVFAPQVVYPVGSQPNVVAVADMNSDGKPDILVGYLSQNTVSVLSGNGDGTFQSPKDIPVGPAPTWMAVGDFNGDGRPDFASTNRNSVSVQLGSSSSVVTFSGVTLPGSYRDNVVASYSGDSSFGSSTSNTLNLASNLTPAATPMFSLPGGTYSSAQTVTLSSATPNSTIYYTTDGTVPGIGSTAYSGPITVTGSEAINAVAVAIGYLPSTVATATYTITTTSTTLAVTSSGSPVTTVSTGALVSLTATVENSNNGPVNRGTVTFYDGTAALGTVGVVGQTNGSKSAGTATLNLASLPPGTDSLTAVFNGFNTAQTSTSSAVQLTVTGFYATTTFLTSSGVQGSYVLNAVVNGSGPGSLSGNVIFTDSSINTTLGTVPISAFSSKPAFMNSITPNAPNGPELTVTGDFNGDGKEDIAIANVSGPMLTVMLGNGDGTFVALPGFGTNFSGHVSFLAVGDFNNDGALDIATADGSSVGIFLGNGDGTFGAEVDYPIAGSLTGASTVGVADLNGDGILDVVTANGSSNNVSVLLGNGDGTFRPHMDFPVGNLPVGMAFGDFNKDGFLDVAVSNNADSTISVLAGNGDGTFQIQHVFPVGTQPSGLATADLNGDGNLDLVVPDRVQNLVSVLLGAGDGTFAQQTIYAVGNSPNNARLADVDGDGKIDIITANTGDNSVSILLGNGDGTFRSQQTVPVGSGVNYVTLGDFNGDGRPDFVTANFASDTLSVELGIVANSIALNGVTLPGNLSDAVLASYSGDSNFSSSTSNTLNLASNPVLAILPTSLPAGTVGVTYSQGVTASGGSAPYSYSYSGLLPNGLTLSPGGVISGTPTSAGSFSFTVTATDSSAAPGPFKASQSYMVSIRQGTQAITFTPVSSPVTYGVAPISLSAAGGGSGNPLIFSVISGPGSVSGNILTINGAGTIVVAADQAGGVNYTAAPEVTQSITVNQATQAITFAQPPTPVTFGVAPITLSATSTSGLGVSFTVLTGPASVSGNILTITGGGTVVLGANQAGNNNYASAMQVTRTITVNPRAQVITFTAPVSPVKYGVAPVTLSATSTSGLTVAFSIVSGPASLTGNTLTLTGVGTVVVAANQPGNASYTAAAQVTHSIIVNQGTQTITFPQPASPVKYGVAPITLSATGGGSGNPVILSLVSGPASLSGNTLTITGVGAVTVAANQAGNANYLAAAQVTRSITVNQGIPAITWPAPAAITYGTALSAAQLNASTTVSGSFAYTPVAGTVPGAGTVVLSTMFTPTDTTDYATVTDTVNLTVKKATPAITWPTPAAITYGTALSSTQLNATTSIAGSFVYTPAAGTILGGGTQVLQESFTPTDTADYNVVTSTVHLTVNKAPQSIVFTPIPSPQQVGATVGLLATGGNSGNGVVFSVVSGPGTIGGNGSLLAFTAPGTVVVAANQSGTSDYANAPQVTQSITVSKLPQAINFTVASSSVTYGVPPVALTASVASGLTVQFSVLSGPASVSGNTLTFKGAGTVVVAANQSGNATYLAAPQVTQTITVNKASQIITFVQPTSPVSFGTPPVTLSATSTSGLTATFSVVSGPATVSGTSLKFTGRGTVIVAANQAGNANYLAAPNVTWTIVVN